MRVTSLDQTDSWGRALGARLVDPSPPVEDQAAAGIRAEVLAQSIARLSPRSREIVTILYGIDHDELSLKTIARRLGLSIVTARAERDYALYQLEYLIRTHRHSALLAA